MTGTGGGADIWANKQKHNSVKCHYVKIVVGLYHVETKIFWLPFRVFSLLDGKLSQASCSLHQAYWLDLL